MAEVSITIFDVKGKALDQPCHADVLLEWANAPGGAE